MGRFGAALWLKSQPASQPTLCPLVLQVLVDGFATGQLPRDSPVFPVLKQVLKLSEKVCKPCTYILMVLIMLSRATAR